MPPFSSQSLPPEKLLKPALWFIFEHENILLYQTCEQLMVPQLKDIGFFKAQISRQYYFGIYQDIHCFALELVRDAKTPENFLSIPFRQAHEYIEQNLFLVATRAKQLLHWEKASQFCGYCGHRTVFSNQEYCKICPHCQALFFPPVSPVVLVLITRNDQILLARSAHFREGIYSVLAGFIEPGESAEQAAARETLEEVGIAIKNIRYFSSQPWPFPNNLMLGFTAEYDSGEIQMDPKEIEDAKWYSIDQLPQLPNSFSLSRQMIDDFVSNF